MTQATRAQDIKREWHLVDIKDKVLGRASTEIAKYLMGKSKPDFVRNLDCGDYVVVTNAKDVKLTGKKETKKVYYRHSGYPGGQKAETVEELRSRKPEEIVIKSVKGMLPQNKLRASMLKRLYVYKDENHPYQEKLKA